MCKARGRPKLGVFVAMPRGKAAYYCLAVFPPHDIRDAKWMALPERLHNCVSPRELYEALPKCVPSRRRTSSNM